MTSRWPQRSRLACRTNCIDSPSLILGSVLFIAAGASVSTCKLTAPQSMARSVSVSWLCALSVQDACLGKLRAKLQHPIQSRTPQSIVIEALDSAQAQLCHASTCC